MCNMDPNSPVVAAKRRLHTNGWETDVPLTPVMNAVRTFKLSPSRLHLGLYLTNLSMRIPSVSRASGPSQLSYCCVVYAVMKNSEARLQGFCPGDVIIKVGGKDVQGMRFNSIRLLLTSQADDSKPLTIQVRYLKAHRIYDLVNERKRKMADLRVKELQLASLLKPGSEDYHRWMLMPSLSFSTISRQASSPSLSTTCGGSFSYHPSAIESVRRSSLDNLNQSWVRCEEMEPYSEGPRPLHREQPHGEGEQPGRWYSSSTLDSYETQEQSETEDVVPMREHTGPGPTLFLKQQQLKLRQSLLLDPDVSLDRVLLSHNSNQSSDESLGQRSSEEAEGEAALLASGGSVSQTSQNLNSTCLTPTQTITDSSKPHLQTQDSFIRQRSYRKAQEAAPLANLHPTENVDGRSEKIEGKVKLPTNHEENTSYTTRL